MVSNPLYGRHPETDVAQLRALRLLPQGEWRGPGCGDRCVRVFAEIMGGAGREGRGPANIGYADIVEAHDGAAHEAYVHALYVPRVVRTGCLTVDINARRLWVDGREIRERGPVRLRFILALASRVGAVVLRDELWTALHGPDVAPIYSPAYWSSTVNNLRHHLGAAAGLIETRADIGYMLRAEEP